MRSGCATSAGMSPIHRQRTLQNVHGQTPNQIAPGRRGNNLTKSKDFYLKAKASILPRLSYLAHTRSTALGLTLSWLSISGFAPLAEMSPIHNILMLKIGNRCRERSEPLERV